EATRRRPMRHGYSNSSGDCQSASGPASGDTSQGCQTCQIMLTNPAILCFTIAQLSLSKSVTQAKGFGSLDLRKVARNILSGNCSRMLPAEERGGFQRLSEAQATLETVDRARA